MAVFKCKMCGGTLEINNNETVAVCEYCGTKQTLPKLDDDRKANLYDRANHFRRNNEFDKAMGIYEQILNEDSTDAESYWSLVLCRYGIEYVEDPATHKRIPTVNRAQYTSIFDDEDYKSALQYADGSQKEVYEAEAAAINEIQKGILEISQREEPFDVFICYKETDQNGRRTPDSVLATELYHELTREGFKVFFSRITLEDKLGQEYEPYIFAALNSAKVMVVIGTRPEHFNAVWVKNEWSRYLALIKNGAKKTLIPAYRDMDPYDLPEEFSHLQAQDMSKLGFIQDLIHGIKKVASADKTILSASSPRYNSNSLIERGYIALESKEWKKAEELFEEALKNEPKNSEAYLGLSMVNKKYSVVSCFDKCKYNLNKDKNYLLAIKYADGAKKEQLQQVFDDTQHNLIVFKNKTKKCVKRISITVIVLIAVAALGFGGYFGYNEYIAPAITYNKAEKLLSENKYSEAKTVYRSLGDYKDSKDKVYESDYLLAEEYFSDEDYTNANKIFNALKSSNYKDSAQKVIDVNQKYAEKLFNDGNYQQAKNILVNIGIESGELYDTIKAKIISEAEKKAGAFDGTGYISCTVSELFNNPQKYNNKKVVVSSTKVIDEYEENTAAGTFYDLLLCDDTSHYQDYFGRSIIKCYFYFSDIIEPYNTPYIGVRIFENTIRNTLAEEKREMKVFGVFTYNSGSEGSRYVGDPYVFDIKADYYIEY